MREVNGLVGVIALITPSINDFYIHTQLLDDSRCRVNLNKSALNNNTGSCFCMRTQPQRLWAFASGSGLTFLFLLIIAALLAALYDIAQQLIQSDRASRISDVIITFGTYVVVVSFFDATQDT